MRTRPIAACLLAVACGGEAEPADPPAPPGTLETPADLEAAVAVTRAAGAAAIAMEIDQSRPFSALDATGVWDFGADAGTFVVARDPHREDEVDQQVAIDGDRRWQRPAAGGPWEEAPAERWGAASRTSPSGRGPQRTSPPAPMRCTSSKPRRPWSSCGTAPTAPTTT